MPSAPLLSQRYPPPVCAALGPTVQVLARLRSSDPELHGLLTSGPQSLVAEQDMEELSRALDSVTRMGLGGPAEAGAAAGHGNAGNATAGRPLGFPGVGGTPDVEEEAAAGGGVQEISDAELLAHARMDPDLAALLRGDSASGMELDRVLGRCVLSRG